MKRSDTLIKSTLPMIVIALVLGLSVVWFNSLRSPPQVFADDDVRITSIEMVSTPSVEETYGLGETVEFAANFNQDVEVQGYVVMGLWVGDKWRGALYNRGSGTDQLVFGYEVQPDDADSDGIKVHDGYVESNGTRHGIGGSGVIVESNGETQVSPWYDGTNDQSTHKVDGSRVPRAIEVRMVGEPENGDTYRAGESITLDVVFSAPVRAINRPLASLWFDDSGWRGAWYESGSDTSVLRFSYEVRPADRDVDGLLVGYKDAQGLGEGKIKALNHDVDAIHTYGELRPGYMVDGRPYVKGLEVTSTPASGDGIYGQGEYLEITATFDQQVDKDGDVELRLGLEYPNDESKYAAYLSGDGTSAFVFEYEVATEDYDDNGISIVSGDGGLLEGDGTVTAKGTDVELDDSHPGLTDVDGHELNGGSLAHDTSAPRINSVRIVTEPENGDTYATGDQITVAVTFNEPVSVFGTPLVDLEIGSEEKSALFWDRSFNTRDQNTRDIDRMGMEPAVLFAYTVQEGDLDSDGLSIGANKLALNDGAIWDKIGNYADLTHGAVEADQGQRVEALDVTAPFVSGIAVTSDPGEDGLYGIGDEIEIEVTFNEDVLVSGTPQLELGIDTSTASASFLTRDGATAVFSYMVAEGDDAPGGIAIAQDALDLNGGSIEDIAGNPADLAHEAMEANEAHSVDGVRPTVGGAETSADGDEIEVNFSEDVALSGVLQTLGDAVDVSDEAFLRAFMSITVGDQEVIASSAQLSGNTLTLGLPTEVTEGQTVTVAFEDLFDDDEVPIIVDLAGNAMDDFVAQSVDNMSSVSVLESSEEAGTDVVLSASLLELVEGESATYTVALSSQPTDKVSVTITRVPDAPLALPFLTMYFTPQNWDEPQSVTIVAEPDADDNSHIVFLSHTAHGGGYYLEHIEMRVVITDNNG